MDNFICCKKYVVSADICLDLSFEDNLELIQGKLF